MADGTPLAEIPTGAIPILRSASTSSTLYTVGTGRRLHVTAAWLTDQGATTAGLLSILADVENDTSREVLALSCGISAAPGVVTQLSDSISISGIDVPIVAAGTVALLNTGVAGGTFKGGFYGWEEAVTK